MVGNVSLDCGFKFRDRPEKASTNAVFADVPEKTFHHIEPGGTGGSEVGVGQADLVSVLQQPRPQGLLQSDRRPDDRLRDVLVRILLTQILTPMLTHDVPPSHEGMRPTIVRCSSSFSFSPRASAS